MAKLCSVARCGAKGVYLVHLNEWDGTWRLCVKHERRWRRTKRLGKNPKWLPQKKACELYQAGFTITEIAHQYAVHKSTVSRALKKAGITERHFGSTELDISKITNPFPAA